ncbi:anthranilate synthase component II [Psychrobacter phenylpyruvicus]|uniref:Anthranilate synthase component II n=1 Tax=Psychrobacter phenylpyruvicus TaxID=29432 RepID=A0A379LIH1_9GAMM|nr:aminodeoxychorismate/anthranilate synthase component II [Psychrobacter phenylpyruvicus]SUD90366.1 Anthranilate synthase component II [Psychrobacter phenylpyruvicus]
MILLLDNYDSFTYNIVQYLQQLGAEVEVAENDKVSLADIEKLNPTAIVLGPGPGTPSEAGITLQCIKHFAGKLPLLGVCLGHQAIAQYFGANIVHAPQIMHGRTSQVFHDQRGVFKGLDNPTEFTRYHSLIIDKNSLPDSLMVSAWTSTRANKEDSSVLYNKKEADEIMGIRHKQLPIEGVQFHPESILSQAGLKLFENFLQQHHLLSH